MNAIKVHSGQNHSNSISFRGAPSGFRDSIRAATGTGQSSDVVYPPGTNHKMGNKLPLSMIWEVFFLSTMNTFYVYLKSYNKDIVKQW